MKLRNLKLDESIKKEYEHALEDEHTILEPTEANALKVEEERKEIIEDDFKEQDKVADEIAKATNATEVNEPKKVKDRKELSKLLAEAKEAGKQFKISRCNEEGYRYLFETIETPVEETKEVLTEAEAPAEEVEEVKVEEETVEESLPETFDEKMDFLAKDEDEAIAGYEKIIPSLEEENVKEQLNKILEEEKAHKAFLEAVKADHSLVYEHEHAEEEVKEEEKVEVVEPVEECKESLTEADEPAAESIENCQKWVDYDMEHYGDVSANTRDIIEKAGFQLIKDDHGDYEVAAGKFESLTEESNMDKIKKALGMDMEESLSEDDHFDFMSELYDEMRAVLKKYADKGVTKKDLEGALNFIDVHMDDDEELEFLDVNEEEDKASETRREDDVEESLEESNGKKSAGSVLNNCQAEWGVATSPDHMRQLILKCLEEHKDEMADEDFKYAKMTFEKAGRNAIFGLVAAFTTGMAMSPNKQHKQNLKDLETESLEETTSETTETLNEECENCEEKEEVEVEDEEKPFEEEKVEYEIDDEFDWKY